MGSSIELNIMKGDIIESSREIPMRSFTRQFLWLLAKYMIGDSGNDMTPFLRAKKMDGTDVSFRATPVSERATSGMRIFTDSDHNYDFNGIIIGTGNRAVDADDYALESRITAGNGPGQLAFANNIDLNFDYSGRKAVFSRKFRNNTASNITVSELGVALTNTPDDAAAVSKQYLIIRDVPETPIVVEPEKYLDVIYKIQLPYSSSGGFTQNFLLSLFGGIFNKKHLCFAYSSGSSFDYSTFGSLFSQTGKTVDSQPENVCRAGSNINLGIVPSNNTSIAQYATSYVYPIPHGEMNNNTQRLYYRDHSWGELEKIGNTIVWELRRPFSHVGSYDSGVSVRTLGISIYTGSSYGYMVMMHLPVTATINRGQTKEFIIRLSTAAG